MIYITSTAFWFAPFQRHIEDTAVTEAKHRVDPPRCHALLYLSGHLRSERIEVDLDARLQTRIRVFWSGLKKEQCAQIHLFSPFYPT